MKREEVKLISLPEKPNLNKPSISIPASVLLTCTGQRGREI